MLIIYKQGGERRRRQGEEEQDERRAMERTEGMEEQGTEEEAEDSTSSSEESGVELMTDGERSRSQSPSSRHGEDTAEMSGRGHGANASEEEKQTDAEWAAYYARLRNGEEVDEWEYRSDVSEHRAMWEQWLEEKEEGGAAGRVTDLEETTIIDLEREEPDGWRARGHSRFREFCQQIREGSEWVGEREVGLVLAGKAGKEGEEANGEMNAGGGSRRSEAAQRTERAIVGMSSEDATERARAGGEMMHIRAEVKGAGREAGKEQRGDEQGDDDGTGDEEARAQGGRKQTMGVALVKVCSRAQASSVRANEEVHMRTIRTCWIRMHVSTWPHAT